MRGSSCNVSVPGARTDVATLRVRLARVSRRWYSRKDDSSEMFFL